MTTSECNSVHLCNRKGEGRWLSFATVAFTVYIGLLTDNVFAVKSWCKNKFGLEDSAIDKQFSIPEDFDYIN